MGESAAVIAAELRHVSDDLVAFVVACSEEDWRAITQAEQWPVCVVCRHIARAFEVQPQVIERAASGLELPSGYTWDDIHRSNAEQAREWSGVSKEETLHLLYRYSDTAVAFVSGLSDEQLDHITKAPLDDAMISVRQMVEGMIDHARVHGESVRATIAVR